MTLFKLEYMNEIRIVELQNLTINDLYSAFQMKFNLKEMRLRPRFLLKFLDMDGDWITLVDDNDIMLALRQMKGSALRLKLVDSYQMTNSVNNEEWDLRPLFSQLLNSPAVQNSISKMVENILQSSNQMVEVRTHPNDVKMPSNYSAPTAETDMLPSLDDDIVEVD